MSQDEKKPNGDHIEIRPNGDNIDFTSESKLLRWWDNYWYHYKWHTIIGLFVIFLVFFCVMQAVNDPKEDTLVVYCGPFGFQSEEMEDLREAMNRIMPEDFDGSGEKYTEIVRYQVFSEAELENDREANGGQGMINPAYNAKQLSDFNSFMSFGEASIYFVSEHIYGIIKDRGVLKPLSDALGQVPDNAYDAYAIRLKDTHYYAIEPALRMLPEDTLVCITAPYQLGTSSDPEMYDRSLCMFKSIILGK